MRLSQSLVIPAGLLCSGLFHADFILIGDIVDIQLPQLLDKGFVRYNLVGAVRRDEDFFGRINRAQKTAVARGVIHKDRGKIGAGFCFIGQIPAGKGRVGRIGGVEGLRSRLCTLFHLGTAHIADRVDPVSVKADGKIDGQVQARSLLHENVHGIGADHVALRENCDGCIALRGIGIGEGGAGEHERIHAELRHIADHRSPLIACKVMQGWIVM